MKGRKNWRLERELVAFKIRGILIFIESLPCQMDVANPHKTVTCFIYITFHFPQVHTARKLCSKQRINNHHTILLHILALKAQTNHCVVALPIIPLTK